MKSKRNMRIGRFILLAAIALISTFATNAQTTRKNTAFIIKVKGSSNLHDWTMEAKSGTIEANLNLASNVSYLAGIQSLTFTFHVKNLNIRFNHLKLNFITLCLYISLSAQHKGKDTYNIKKPVIKDDICPAFSSVARLLT